MKRDKDGKQLACVIRMGQDNLQYEHHDISALTELPPVRELAPPAGDGVYQGDGSPNIAAYKWGQKTVTYCLVLNDGEKFVDIPDTHDIAISVNMALTIWELYGDIKFQRLVNQPWYDADISIKFDGADPMFKTPGVMAYTYFPNTKPAANFTSVYNSSLLWSETGKYNFAYNINETLRHELGHSWGAVHTTNPKDIMYPYYHNDLWPTAMDVYQCQMCCGVRDPPVNPVEMKGIQAADASLEEFPDKPVISKL